MWIDEKRWCGNAIKTGSRVFAAGLWGVTIATSAIAAGDDAAVAEAAAVIAAHAESPKFWAPPSFNTSSARGKTVWWIADQTQNILQQWAEAGSDAAKVAGLNFHLFDPGSSVAEHVRAFNLAIAAKADAIVLGDGYPAVAFSAQVADAKKHGIPVFSLVSHPFGADTDPKVDGLVADVSYNYPEAGKLLADWFVADSKGKGRALIIYLKGIPSGDWELEGFKDELKRLGTEASFTEASTNFGPSEQADTVNVVSTAILRDPSIGYVIPPFDSQALFAQTGLAQLGPSGAKIKTAGFNTILPQMTNLQRGGTPLKIDLGGPNVWLGYAAIDDVLRALTGQPVIHDYKIGYRVFDHKNVQGLNLSKEDDQNWYGIDYGALFKPVWQLQ
jgi:ribose transport system substrate-binding protein